MKNNSEVTKQHNVILKDLENRVFEEWKRSAENRAPDGPGLMIFGSGAPVPDFRELMETSDGPVLQMERGVESHSLCWGEIPVALTCARQLPLQTRRFGLVLLSHIISDGKESELEEACRVLKPGGLLLVLGLNRNGLRYLRGRSQSDMPGLRPLAVRGQLEQFDMNVRTVLAEGFLKRRWPEQMNQGLARMLIPVADLLLVVARKEEPRLATPVKRTQLRTANMQARI